MFAKLAITNAKKPIKDYSIYFITITLCVGLFYAFMSLSSSSYELITEDSYNFEMLQDIMKYSTYVITALLAILVGYVNNYVMKRRKREFATYILLGTEQKSVALMFFIETLIIGSMAIFLGVFVGTLFSQVVTALILLTAKQEIIFNFRLYIDTVVITFIFFLAMFFIIGINNIRVLRKLKLIDMLNAEKKSEFQFKRSGKVYGIVFILAIILYSVCGYCTIYLIKADNERTVTSMVSETVYTAVALVSFIIATYTLFYSLAYILILVKEKWINFKYEDTNLFLIGTIVSKLKTAPILMATISITFFGAAVSFIVTLIMSQWSLGYLDYRAPYDIDVRTYYNIDENRRYESIEDIPNFNYGEIISYLNKDNNLEEYCIIDKYFINPEDFNIRDRWSRPLNVVKLSQFNKARSMLGYDEIKLKEDEFTTHWAKSIEENQIQSFIKENSKINIGGEELRLSSNDFYKESLGEGIFNLFTDTVIIVPDNICNNLTLATSNLIGNLKKDLKYEEGLELENSIIPNWYADNNKEIIEKYNKDYVDYSEELIAIRIKSVETSEMLNLNLGMRILGIYLGIVLLMISLTVLALQQLADSIEHKSRFNVLRNLGVEEDKIYKIVLKQISIYFIIPVFIALVGVIVFSCNYFKVIETEISFYVGDKAFIANIVFAVILLISIYIVYFLGTYYTFKRNINN